MKRIARKAGGATDTSRDYEYTDWAALDEFVDRFSRRFGTPRSGKRYRVGRAGDFPWCGKVAGHPGRPCSLAAVIVDLCRDSAILAGRPAWHIACSM